MRFTDAYIVSPLCSVSRAGILTGRYPQRWGQEFNPRATQAADSVFGIPLSVPLMSERLKSLGYRTGLIGKWLLGYFPPNRPTDRGFDEFFGFLGPTHRYGGSGRRARMGKVLHGTEEIPQTGFLTGLLSHEAVKFVDTHAAEPFLLYLPFNAVHGPLEQDPALQARVAGIPDPKRRMYASLLMGMDDAVGAVLQALDRHGLRQKTLIIFVSDNGGPTTETTSSNAPFRGIKAEVLEGAIRVPFLLAWPGHVAAGQTYSAPISSLDLMPTVLAAVGAPPPRPNDVLDGVNILSFLTGKPRPNAVPHDRLFWRMGEESAVREGRWKLIQLLKTAPLLFDLEADPGESKDLHAAHPDVVTRLQKAFATWALQMQQPKWGKGLGEDALRKQRGKEH